MCRLRESHRCCTLISALVMPTVSSRSYSLLLIPTTLPKNSEQRKFLHYFWTQAKYVQASESSHLLLRHPETLRLRVVTYWCFSCLLAAGLWLSKTLYCVKQLQPQQPSQSSFSSQDQEPLPGELWPCELGLMNCFSFQIRHHSSLLSPSPLPVPTFIILTPPLPLSVIWEWAREAGRLQHCSALPHPLFPRFDSSKWAKLGCW